MTKDRFTHLDYANLRAGSRVIDACISVIAPACRLEGQADGEMAYFIDGKPAHSKKDVSWRTSADLKLNMVRLQHYNETSDVKSHSNRIWFDDVVVSTKPIGCLP